MIYQWPIRQEAEQVMDQLKTTHPNYEYGPIVLLNRGYAIIVSDATRTAFVGKKDEQ